MAEYRLYDPADPPEWLDPKAWQNTPNCDHLGHPAQVHTARLRAVADLVVETFDTFPDDWPLFITDVGAGDGALLSLLPDRVREHAVGYEIITDSVRVARFVRQVDVRHANVQQDPIDWGTPNSLAVCTEMLEHLADPHRFVREVLSGAGWLIASSPHAETPESHEWNHAWAWDHDGYRALFERNGFDVVKHFNVGWSQVVLAKCRWAQVSADRVTVAA